MTVTDVRIPPTSADLRVPPTSPTLEQVAALAGVSIATASRVLNNSAPASDSARQRVREAVARLGYVRHRAAPAKRHPRTRCVAAIVCEDDDRVFADPFFARVITTASKLFTTHDVALMVIPATRERLPLIDHFLRAGNLDGVVMLSVHGRHPLSTSLPARGVPLTMIGRPLYPTKASWVDADNRGGARGAVEHLIRRGRTAIATIAGPPDMAVGADRLGGYRDALASAGMPSAGVAYGDFTHNSGVHAMWRLLDQRPGLDAVFVASDIMATGALHALHRAGRRVPDDVAVIGFDDLPFAQRTDPPLTTVRQPLEQMGTLAAQHLLACLDGLPAPEEPPIPTMLITRASA